MNDVNRNTISATERKELKIEIASTVPQQRAVLKERHPVWMSLFACNYFFNCFSNYSFVEVFSLIFGKSAAKNVGKETAEKPFNLIGNLKLSEVVKYKDSCRVAKKFNSTTRRIHNTRCVHDMILLLQLFEIQPE